MNSETCIERKQAYLRFLLCYRVYTTPTKLFVPKPRPTSIQFTTKVVCCENIWQGYSCTGTSIRHTLGSSRAASTRTSCSSPRLRQRTRTRRLLRHAGFGDAVRRVGDISFIVGKVQVTLVSIKSSSARDRNTVTIAISSTRFFASRPCAHSNFNVAVALKPSSLD